MSEDMWLKISDDYREILINSSNIITIKNFYDIQLELYCIHIIIANGKEELLYSNKQDRNYCYEKITAVLKPVSINFTAEE